MRPLKCFGCQRSDGYGEYECIGCSCYAIERRENMTTDDDVKPQAILIGRRYATAVIDIRADDNALALINTILDKMHDALLRYGLSSVQLIELTKGAVPMAMTGFSISAIHAGTAIRLNLTYTFSAPCAWETEATFAWPNWSER